MKLMMCELLLYQEHFAGIDDIVKIIQEKESIKKYAIILHDKDGIKPHYHVMLHFGVSYDTDRLLDYFNIKANAISKIKGRWKDALQYLTHRNAPNKHQYEDEEVVSNFDWKDEVKKSVRKSEVDQTILEYSNLDITYTKLWERLTPAERLDKKHLIDKASEVRNTNIKMKGHRNMKVIYITGPSGSGKTTFAKFYAEKIKRMDYYVSSSSNDPLQDYMGQEVIIMDDLRGDAFTITDLLKLLDNHTQSSVKSRYFNKAVDCKMIIITSVKQVWELYNFHEKQEPFLQLLRRVSEFLDIDHDGNIFTKRVDFDVWHTQNKVQWKDRIKQPLTFGKLKKIMGIAEELNQLDITGDIQKYMKEVVK
jgi:energy-coupling factor transporter ATP-binding protein EcfA2